MDAKTAILEMRHWIGDSQKAKFSDDALMLALNTTLALVFEMFVGYASTIGRKSATVVLTGGSGDLPNDFHSVVIVEDNLGNEMLPDYGGLTPSAGHYKIVGGKLYAGTPSVNMEYHYIPQRLTSGESVLDVPDAILNQMVQVAVTLAKGDRMGADKIVYSMVRSLASRHIPYVPDRRAFK